MRFLAVILLALTGCAPPETWQPLPFQRSTPDETPGSSLRALVRMSDVDASRHFVRDIDATLQSGAWRWTGKRPELKLFLESTENIRVLVEYAVAGDTFRETGPVNVTLYVNGKRVAGRRCEADGRYQFQEMVAPGLLRAKAENTIALEVDKIWTSPVDGAKMGLILLSAGFGK